MNNRKIVTGFVLGSVGVSLGALCMATGLGPYAENILKDVPSKEENDNKKSLQRRLHGTRLAVASIISSGLSNQESEEELARRAAAGELSAENTLYVRRLEIMFGLRAKPVVAS